MAGIVSTAAAAAGDAIIQALRSPDGIALTDAVMREPELLGEFPANGRTWNGGPTHTAKFNYAGNMTVGRYSEGDAPPTMTAQSYITVSWPKQNYQGLVRISGHAKDELRNANTYWNVWEEELRRTMQDIVRLVDNDLKGTSLTAPVGVLGMIDSAGNIAGIDRATYGWFQAIENTCAVSGAIGLGDLDLLYQESRDTVEDGGTAQGGVPSKGWNCMYSSFKVERKLVRETRVPGETRPAPFSYANAPLKPLTPPWPQDTLVAGIRETIAVLPVRDWQYEALGKTGDSDAVLITGSFAPVCDDPRKWAKLTGC